MGRVWVLDTGTKGTGAEMVPLEKVLQRPDSARERPFVAPKLEPQPEEARSIVDVTLYVWEPDAEDWRMLTHRERRLLWERRRR